ncbi:MAG TPA: Asp23/Gls24 family envelope stress response protein [Gaiellaceae bacterium]|nr:Asp23/Gls24 family envelope stress response protein [Gaiellaceae bacterium]
MERQEHVLASSELGRVAVSTQAIAQIVAAAAAESYGVVALGGRRRLRLPGAARRAVEVRAGEDGLVVRLHVVVEHGLRLAEVAAAVEDRVRYELGRMVGLPLAAVEVHIDRVRR